MADDYASLQCWSRQSKHHVQTIGRAISKTGGLSDRRSRTWMPKRAPAVWAGLLTGGGLVRVLEGWARVPCTDRGGASSFSLTGCLHLHAWTVVT